MAASEHSIGTGKRARPTPIDQFHMCTECWNLTPAEEGVPYAHTCKEEKNNLRLDITSKLDELWGDYEDAGIAPEHFIEMLYKYASIKKRWHNVKECAPSESRTVAFERHRRWETITRGLIPLEVGEVRQEWPNARSKHDLEKTIETCLLSDPPAMVYGGDTLVRIEENQVDGKTYLFTVAKK